MSTHERTGVIGRWLKADDPADRLLSVASGAVIVAAGCSPAARSVGRLGLGLLGAALISRGLLGWTQSRPAEQGTREDPVVRDVQGIGKTTPYETEVV